MKILITKDNQGCITAPYNPLSTDLSRHVKVQYQLVVDIVENGSVVLHYIQTDVMIANIFTKNLKPAKFAQLKELTKMQKGKNYLCVDQKCYIASQNNLI